MWFRVFFTYESSAMEIADAMKILKDAGFSLEEFRGK